MLKECYLISDLFLHFILVSYRYDSDNEMFLLRVRECVENSKTKIYETPTVDDPHAIVFSPYQPAIHDQVREELKKERVSINVYYAYSRHINGSSFLFW